MPYCCFGFDNRREFNQNGKRNVDLDKWFDRAYYDDIPIGEKLYHPPWDYSLKHLVRNRDQLETKLNFQKQKEIILSKKKKN